VYPQAIYDLPRDRMLLNSGRDISTNASLDETYELTFSGPGAPQWRQLATSGSGGGRYEGPVVYDRIYDQMIVQGGYYYTHFMGDTEEMDTKSLQLGSPFTEPDVDTPSSVDFGTVVTGQSKLATMTIYNTGGSDLLVTNISSGNPTIGASPAAFTLAPGQPQNVTIGWGPLTPGPLSASVTIVSNDPDTPNLDVDLSGTAEGVLDAQPRARTEFALDPITPNPSQGPIGISFAVAHETHVRLSVLDVSGRHVATLVDGSRAAGAHHAVWDGTSARGAAGAGLYFVRYEAGEKTLVRRFALTR
jgi:hypothetical protein